MLCFFLFLFSFYIVEEQRKAIRLMGLAICILTGVIPFPRSYRDSFKKNLPSRSFDFGSSRAKRWLRVRSLFFWKSFPNCAPKITDSDRTLREGVKFGFQAGLPVSDLEFSADMRVNFCVSLAFPNFSSCTRAMKGEGGRTVNGEFR